jgi:hypothetical protein
MDKSEIKKAYKQSLRPMGVYRIKTLGHDKIFIGLAADLQARFNRHKAELKFGNHRNKALQEIWNASGESSFEFEILDVLDPKEKDQSDHNEELKVLTEMWIQKFQKAGQSVVFLKSG